MKKVISLKSLASSKLLLAGILVSLSVLSPKAQATGGGDECDDMSCNSFFSPEVIRNPDEVPFFNSYRVFYQQPRNVAADTQAKIAVVNMKDWLGFFDNKISEQSLTYLVYKMPIVDLSALTQVMNGKPGNLSPQAKALKKSFDSYGQKEKVVSALRYLGFAKRVEPIATRRSGEDYWDTDKADKYAKEDAAAAEKMILSSEELVGKLNNKFLEQRMRFQVLRLMYYTKRYADAQKYFETHKGRFTEENSAKYRFMDAAAGAYYKDKKYGKANYLYSLIFDKFATLKRTSYYSFHPKEEADWKDSLAMAQNDREREVLWQLLGIYVDGLTAIDKIFAMNPGSNLLPLLLVREVNKAEESWTSNDEKRRYPVDYTGGQVVSDREAVGVKRLEMIKSITDSGKAFKPYLWQLSLAHLYALAGDSRESEKYLQLASSSIPNEEEGKNQIRMTAFFNKVNAMKSVESSKEGYFAQEFPWLKNVVKKTYRAQTLDTWLKAKLSKLYAANSDPIRSLLLTDEPGNAFYQTNKNLEAFMAFLNKSNKSAFDSFLASSNSYKPDQIQEMKALNLLYTGSYKEAAEAFKQVGGEVATRALESDPFMIHIRDCHECDAAAPHTKYTKVSFANKVQELAAKANGSDQAAADASFELANGLYNMSYYGNGREIFENDHGNYDRSLARNLNMDQAEKFYLQAQSASQNREFQAKAVFMAAKAEQNRYYYSHRDDRNSDSDIHPGKYYKVLKDTYKDTAYYQEIIKECGYFRTWAQKN